MRYSKTLHSYTVSAECITKLRKQILSSKDETLYTIYRDLRSRERPVPVPTIREAADSLYVASQKVEFSLPEHLLSRADPPSSLGPLVLLDDQTVG